jgi:hypothetical protein
MDEMVEEPPSRCVMFVEDGFVGKGVIFQGLENRKMWITNFNSPLLIELCNSAQCKSSSFVRYFILLAPAISRSKLELSSFGFESQFSVADQFSEYFFLHQVGS